MFFRPELIQHSTECIVRLLRACMGPSAVSDRKVESGPSLIILGVELQLDLEGYRCRPSKDKVAKCLVCIDKALQSGVPVQCSTYD